VIAYLFDIDGTLIRAHGAGVRALAAVMTRLGIDDAGRGVAAAGRTDPAIVEEIIVNRLGRAPAPGEIDAVLADYVAALAGELERSTTFRVLPDAAAVLTWLGPRPEVRLGLATGNVEAGARLKLTRAGLVEHFGFGGFGCDSADRPALVARAVERSGAGPGDTVVVVGDTIHDVRAARAVGATCVAVTTGPHGRAQLEDEGADVIFDGLGPIVAWHQQRFGAAA